MTLGTGIFCDIPRQGLGNIMWLDGNDPNGNGIKPGLGDSVASWYDKIGFNNIPQQGTALNQPYFIQGIVGNLGAIDFVLASSQSMTFSSSAFNFQGVQPFSIMVCVGPNTLGIDQAIISRWDSAGTQQWMLSINASNQFVFSRGVDVVDSGSTLSTFDFQIVTCTYDGSAMQLFVNGTQVGTTFTATSLSSDANVVTLGNEVGGTMPLDAYIAELIPSVINLSSGQRNFLENYLANKWGIAI